MEDTTKNPIQVAEKLFQVIETLAENGPMGIMELSTALGFHKSTTHRLVTSLLCMGYVRQDAESLKYSLTFRFLEIGNKILEQTNMATLIRPELKKLSERTGETVHLVRREGVDAIYIDKVESHSGTMRMVSRVGNRIPLYCSGVGKALLAELPDEEILEIWQSSDVKRLTAKTVSDYKGLMERIEKVRADGYAIDDEENEAGVRCIAVTLAGYNKEPLYAVSISAPVNRMDGKRIRELAKEVLELKKDAAKAVGITYE
jgi:DNA-binding IclR family transcriptional regulator